MVHHSARTHVSNLMETKQPETEVPFIPHEIITRVLFLCGFFALLSTSRVIVVGYLCMSLFIYQLKLHLKLLTAVSENCHKYSGITDEVKNCSITAFQDFKTFLFHTCLYFLFLSLPSCSPPPLSLFKEY